MKKYLFHFLSFFFKFKIYMNIILQKYFLLMLKLSPGKALKLKKKNKFEISAKVCENK